MPLHIQLKPWNLVPTFNHNYYNFKSHSSDFFLYPFSCSILQTWQTHFVFAWALPSAAHFPSKAFPWNSMYDDCCTSLLWPRCSEVRQATASLLRVDTTVHHDDSLNPSVDNASEAKVLLKPSPEFQYLQRYTHNYLLLLTENSSIRSGDGFPTMNCALQLFYSKPWLSSTLNWELELIKAYSQKRFVLKTNSKQQAALKWSSKA